MTDENVARISVNLKVTNNNDFEIADQFDAVPYVFKPKEALTIPPDAALHIFGWQPGVDMAKVEVHVQRRWGWNTPAIVEKNHHKKFFAKLEFKPVTYKMVEVIETDRH